MWIALGVIGVLWVVGAFVAPDKNAPPNTQVHAPATSTAQQATPPAH
jgi:hypothetical protein